MFWEAYCRLMHLQDTDRTALIVPIVRIDRVVRHMDRIVHMRQVRIVTVTVTMEAMTVM